MVIGKLRHRIRIEQPTETQNQFGEPITTWTPFASVYAEKRDLTGDELFTAQQVKAELTTRFVVRYIPITETMRIVSGETYDIHSISDPDGKKRMLIITAEKIPTADVVTDATHIVL